MSDETNHKTPQYLWRHQLTYFTPCSQGHIENWGYLECKDDYWRVLGSTDVVLSDADRSRCVRFVPQFHLSIVPAAYTVTLSMRGHSFSPSVFVVHLQCIHIFLLLSLPRYYTATGLLGTPAPHSPSPV